MTHGPRKIVQILLDANPGHPIGSIIQFVQYYINRAGKGLDPKRKANAEEAKKILQRMNNDRRKQSSKGAPPEPKE